MPLSPHSLVGCPFCAIAVSSPPSSQPSSTTSPSLSSPAHILLSTPSLVAFLDHAPISRGHVLLATRQHRQKLSDVSVQEGSALGAWIGVLSRAVVGVALEGGEEEEREGKRGGKGAGDWNVVQNNGARAAQVVPHVHFHIIPRPGDVPQIENRSWTIFGRGQREDLDEEDALVLIQNMRIRLDKELERLREREGDGAVRILMGEENWNGESKL